MSYPTPPGGGNPYGQPPPQNGWQPQGQAPTPVPPMPSAPPGVNPVAVPAQPGPYQHGAYYPPGGPVLGAPVPPPPSGGGRTVRRVFGGLLSLFGVLGMLGGGALAAHAWSNHQLQVPNDAYGPVLWRNQTTESIFPATIGNAPDSTIKASDKKVAEWSRMGISENTSCSAGLSGKTKATAEKLGCKAVLRATYVDLTGEMVATVAIIVLPEDGSAAKEMYEFLDDQPSEDVPDAAVVPLKIPGTLAAKWQSSRRNGMGGTNTGGGIPYAVAVTTGAVDGRASSNLPGDWGDYGNDTDRQPWMDAAHALSETFSMHLEDLER